MAHRLVSSSSCHRHPSQSITGFCASCLRERLASIDPGTHHEIAITQLAAELRRCKSYSTSLKNLNTASTISEPGRNSCDGRSRNSLSDLFHLDDKKRRGFFDLGLELKEKEENGAEIRISDEVKASKLAFQDDGFEEDNGKFKTMKEFIDLEWYRKKNNNNCRGFWGATSLFRNKLVKWQVKQKKDNKGKKKDGIFIGGGRDGDLDAGIEKQRVGRLRETQSEIGEYGRSCDTDLRLSLDVARLSADGGRCSFDEPRASWDGYLIGKTYPRCVPPLVSVVEDVTLPSSGTEDREEDVELKNEGESSPGGTAQTRNYYSDTRRKKSFDRLGSNRKMTLGDDELKSIWNAKMSPKTVGLFHGSKLLVTEKELRDSNWYSLKDYHVESTDGLSNDVDSVAGGVSNKGFKLKKLQKWRSVWNIWGLMQRRSKSKCGDENCSVVGNVADGPVAEYWQKLGGVADVEANGTVSQKLIRSYTVSAWDSSKIDCSVSSIETKENGMKRREEFVLQRNQSASHPILDELQMQATLKHIVAFPVLG